MGTSAEAPVITGEVVQAAEGKIQKALQTSARDATPLPPHLRNLPEQQEHQDMQLKREYAGFIKRALFGELVASNTIFVAYAWAGRHWNLPPVVINIWLGSTVVQVIGVVGIVTRHLFPRRDSDTEKEASGARPFGVSVRWPQSASETNRTDRRRPVQTETPPPPGPPVSAAQFRGFPVSDAGSVSPTSRCAPSGFRPATRPHTAAAGPVAAPRARCS